MKPQSVEWLCLDERETIGAAELSGACGMSASELAELVDYGALQPLPARGPEHVFSAACVMPLRAAARLRLDFDLDLFAAAIVPFSLMIVIDSILILFIFKSRKRIRSTAYKTNDTMRRISSKDRKFSITSISLNFIILLCNAPTTIFSIIHHENDPITPSIILFEDYLRFFFYAHYALGFFVQLAINSIIRKEFLKMFNLAGLVKKPSEVRSGHQSELRATTSPTPTTPTQPTVAVIS